MEDIVEQRLSAYVASEQEFLQRRLENIRKILELCESPIERLSLIDVCEQFSDYIFISSETKDDQIPEIFTWSSSLMMFVKDYITPDEVSAKYGLAIYPQYEVVAKIEKEFRSYRLDFLVNLLEKIKSSKPNIILSLALEFDGHDFHERTKEQAQRDKFKDRVLQKLDMKVLRYTGSETFRAAQSRVSRSDVIIQTPALADVLEIVTETINQRMQQFRLAHNGSIPPLD